ncbi:hypothetical protein V8E52_011876 [Russula decolorans]
MSTSSGNPSPASQNTFKFLEPYHLVICAVLALSSPAGWSWAWAWPLSPLPVPLSEFWFHGLILTGLALIGFVAPTTKFSGPLRFGYLEYNTLVATFFQHLPSLSPYAVLFFVFLPSSPYWMLPYWMMCALPVGWQYVLQNYRANVQDTRNKVDTARSLATVAANSAREYAKEAAEYEKQAMEVVAVRRRDARLAESVKVTDFFDRAAVSWAALGSITAAVSDVANAARLAEEDAGEVQGSDRAGTHAYESLQKARSAVANAEDAESKAKYAQTTVRESYDAQQQDAAARQQALANADKAVEAAKDIKDRMAKSPEILSTAVDGAENVRRLADQAMAAAVEGDKKTASSLAADAGRAAEEVVKAKEELFSAKEDTHKIFFELV